MDVRRRDYALINGKPYERERVGAAWTLKCFPPELDAALPGRAASAEAVAPR